MKYMERLLPKKKYLPQNNKNYNKLVKPFGRKAFFCFLYRPFKIEALQFYYAVLVIYFLDVFNLGILVLFKTWKMTQFNIK